MKITDFYLKSKTNIFILGVSIIPFNIILHNFFTANYANLGLDSLIKPDNIYLISLLFTGILTYAFWLSIFNKLLLKKYKEYKTILTVGSTIISLIIIRSVTFLWLVWMIISNLN